jgi:hypothetical protein
VVVGALARLPSNSNKGKGGDAGKKCTRPAPEGGTCKKVALSGGDGLFCRSHCCPECGAGKSSSAPGCPAHLTRPRKESVYNGFEEAEVYTNDAYCNVAGSNIVTANNPNGFEGAGREAEVYNNDAYGNVAGSNIVTSWNQDAIFKSRPVQSQWV